MSNEHHLSRPGAGWEITLQYFFIRFMESLSEEGEDEDETRSFNDTEVDAMQEWYDYLPIWPHKKSAHTHVCNWVAPKKQVTLKFC